MQEGGDDYQSFSEYQSVQYQPGCTCPYSNQPGITFSDGCLEGLTMDVRNKILEVQQTNKCLHQYLDSLLVQEYSKVDDAEFMLDNLQRLAAKQKGKCRSLLHRQVEEEIIAGSIAYNSVRQVVDRIKHVKVRKQLSPQKFSSPQLDTTVENQSFVQTQVQCGQSPFANTYKDCILNCQAPLFEGGAFNVDFKRQEKGVRVSIRNSDQLNRMISVDDCEPAYSILVKWKDFTSQKFVANCKIDAEGVEVPVPLPLNFMFQGRFSQHLSINLVAQLKQRLRTVHKMRIPNVDYNVLSKLQLNPKALQMRKQGQNYIGLFNKKFQSQLYLSQIVKRCDCLQVVVRTSVQSPFFKDLIEFMIFLLSS